MPKTVRFCIRCGREIGESVTCTNPECGGLPNFYRDVPAPQHQSAGRRRADPEASLTTDPQPPPRQTRPPGRPQSFREEVRRTLEIDPTPIAALRSLSKPHEEHLIRAGTTEVGARPPAKLVINKPEISSRHACLECAQGSGGAWLVTVLDHGSTNGTSVNGKRLGRQERRVLADGDRVRFANAEFEFRLLVGEEPRLTIEI